MVKNHMNKPPKRNPVGNVSGKANKSVKVKKEPKTRSIKTYVNGIEFDSQTEADYYKYLLKDKTIQTIELQPEYKIIETYEVECKRCLGRGKITNPRTLRDNNCTLCKGKGKRSKGGAIYTADFKVTYIDGYVEVLDVKGWKAERDFSLRKKLWEIQTGKELIVVRWNQKKKLWVRE